MAKLPLLLWPAAALKEKSSPLTQEEVQSDEFKAKLQDLKDTLVHYRGVGISAIQVGWPVRLFVMHDGGDLRVFINPEITNVDDETIPMFEGCLSVPGVFERVERYNWVCLLANDPDTWERKGFDLVGIEAQCAQHEIEHFDGIMQLTDGAGPVKRDIIRRKIKKQLRLNPLFRSKR